MRTSQIGDRVQAHYTKRFADGSSRSSRVRGDAPLEITVGTAHPQLPGLGSRLVGLAEGQSVAVNVSAEEAYGLPDPTRIFRVDRARFPGDERLAAGQRVSMRLSGGRTRRVRVLEVHGGVVVIDTNHPRSGQPLKLEVELVAILTSTPEIGHQGS
jgi:FKBP-type peptidyl-prolyl cis-trans isomerase SlpA